MTSKNDNPESYFDHQDWNTLIVRKKSSDKKQNTPVKSVDPNKKMEKQIEEGNTKHKKCDQDFKKDFVNWRSSQNLTQRDVAQMFNVQTQVITKLENGQLNHNPQLISKIKKRMAKQQ